MNKNLQISFSLEDKVNRPLDDVIKQNKQTSQKKPHRKKKVERVWVQKTINRKPKLDRMQVERTVASNSQMEWKNQQRIRLHNQNKKLKQTRVWKKKEEVIDNLTVIKPVVETLTVVKSVENKANSEFKSQPLQGSNLTISFHSNSPNNSAQQIFRKNDGTNSRRTSTGSRDRIRRVALGDTRVNARQKKRSEPFKKLAPIAKNDSSTNVSRARKERLVSSIRDIPQTSNSTLNARFSALVQK